MGNDTPIRRSVLYQIDRHAAHAKRTKINAAAML
jgi:hypothetical protein